MAAVQVPSASLFHPHIYLSQLDRLRAKAKRRRRLFQAHGAFSLADTYGREAELCKRLCAEVRRGDYHFSPLARVTAWHDGKRRTIHRPELIDAIVLGAMAQRLTTLLEGTLDDCVHAYRPGRGSQRTIALVCDYLEGHSRARPDPRARGVFALQRDLAAYGESIPTGPESRLWPLIRDLLSRAPDQNEANVLRALLFDACRPEVKLSTGQVVVMDHGLPTGSPIQQPLANLYLAPLDHALRELNPEFYARFGDDLLLLDCDIERATHAAQTMERVTAILGLTWSSHKVHNWYFTTPGRPYSGAWHLRFAPTSHIEYLGARLTFDGRLGLKNKRVRQLLQRARWRVKNTIAAARPEQALACVASSLNHALEQGHSVSDSLTEALHTWVNDRDQLRQLDHQLARMCAEALSGVHGVRAFRRVRAQALRDAGLQSTLQLRRRHRGNT